MSTTHQFFFLFFPKELIEEFWWKEGNKDGHDDVVRGISISVEDLLNFLLRHQILAIEAYDSY